MFAQTKKITWLTAFLALALLPLAFAHAASYNDPSGRVMYLSDYRGDVTYSPAGETGWFAIPRNRPLIRGDRLWTDRRSRAELQLGGAVVRMDAYTGIQILDLSDNVAQLRLTQGSVYLRVRRLERGQVYEISTPTLAFEVTRSGNYRIDVNADDQSTSVLVWNGEGTVYGQRNNMRMRGGEHIRFHDSGLRNYADLGFPRRSSFDRYCYDRDARLDRSASLRYVSEDVIGYSAFDDYGSWSSHSSHGSIWYPSRVSHSWAPYRDGHWSWIDPWGWTWVDNQAWGFAVSHYGRWVHVHDRWGWVPGPRSHRAVYAPALVAFVGGRNWSVGISGGHSPIGWFPLGPREVYVPSYRVSQNYFSQVNISNTNVTNINITNVYNNYSRGDTNITQINYANRGIPGAMTAVPSSVFTNAQPVEASMLTMSTESSARGEISRLAAVAPSQRSVYGSAARSNVQPGADVFQRDVVARHEPPAQLQPFSQRAEGLARTPGFTMDNLQPASKDAERGRAAPDHVRMIGTDGAIQNSRGVDRGEVSSRLQGGAEARPDRSVAPSNVEKAPERNSAPVDRGQSARDRAFDVERSSAPAERQGVDSPADTRSRRDLGTSTAPRESNQQESNSPREARDRNWAPAENKAVERQSQQPEQSQNFERGNRNTPAISQPEPRAESQRFERAQRETPQASQPEPRAESQRFERSQRETPQYSQPEPRAESQRFERAQRETPQASQPEPRAESQRFERSQRETPQYSQPEPRQEVQRNERQTRQVEAYSAPQRVEPQQIERAPREEQSESRKSRAESREKKKAEEEEQPQRGRFPRED